MASPSNPSVHADRDVGEGCLHPQPPPSYPHTHTDGNEEELRLEQAALFRALSSMLTYADDASYEPSRWERCAAALAATSRGTSDATHLAVNEMKRMAASARKCIERNQHFLDDIAASHLGRNEENGAVMIPDGCAIHNVGAEHASRVRYLLRNVVRDWSDEGRGEREQSYARILQELQRHVSPIGDASGRSRVLVPGAGLGRLLLDVCRAGYDAEGNEWSYLMLITSNLILNCHPETAWHIHPYCIESSNVERSEDMMRSVRVPDVVPSTVLGRDAMCMTAGDFVEVYAMDEYKGRFDAILTCFFIDTARNITEYFDVFHHCLRDGGIWVNLGPLMWHWSEGGTQQSMEHCAEETMSVELSLQSVLALAEASGFKRLMHEMVPAQFVRNSLSMQQRVFSCSFFSMQKTATRCTDSPS